MVLLHFYFYFYSRSQSSHFLLAGGCEIIPVCFVLSVAFASSANSFISCELKEVFDLLDYYGLFEPDGCNLL